MTKTFVVKYPCKMFLTQLGFKPSFYQGLYRLFTG